MLNRKTLVILLTIAILVASATTVIASSGRRNHKLPQANEQWEKLYEQASGLVIEALYSQDEFTRQQLLRQAIPVFEEALTLAPDEVNTWNNLAATLYLVGDKDNALKEYTALIQAHPEVSSAYLGRGHIYEEKGEIRKAIQDYNIYLHLIADRPGDVANQNRMETQKLIDDLKKELIRRR